MQHHCRKRFGQNFLNDPQIIAQIVAAVAATESDHLLEIGPGSGAITEQLLQNAGTLTAIELDRDLIPKLTNKFSNYPNFKLLQGDILKFPLDTIFTDHYKTRIVGNLPYNISTPLLFVLLEHLQHLQDLHIMLQYEVAARLAAAPGTKNYGKLSIITQYYCHTTMLFMVPASAFTPMPQVTSAFVRLVPKTAAEMTVTDPAMLQQVTTLAFNKRRKTLRNALKPLLQEADWTTLAIDPNLRPEQLTLAQYIAICDKLIKTL